MALTVPTSDDLLVHMREDSYPDGPSEDFADSMLQHAADMMAIATGYVDDPVDAPIALRVMQIGILAMAHALYIGSDDRAALYSPFGSERIGSYSYSKSLHWAAEKSPTGVPMFDQAVDYLRSVGELGEGADWATAEKVYPTTYPEWEQQENIESLDPVAAVFGSGMPPRPWGWDSTGR